MSRFLLACSLLAGSLVSVPPAAGEETTLESDVRAGDRLEVHNYRGSLRIVAWDRPSIRVVADHPHDEEIVLERRGARWLLVPASWQRDSQDFELRLPDVARVRIVGREPASVDLVVSIPVGMAVMASSPRGDIFVEGIRAPLDLTTMNGDLTVEGGATPVRLRSMIGRIELRGADGRTSVEGATGRVVVRECAGELRVETTTGDVSLEDLRTVDLEVRTLDGDVELRGPLTPTGQYRLTSHSGDVELAVAGPIDAQFTIRAFRGSFSTDLQIDPPPEANRADFPLGEGSARVRLESFSGRVRLSRKESTEP